MMVERFECSDMETSPGHSEILVSPLSSGLAVMVPTQTGFRGTDSLLSVLTPIHAAELTSAHTHFDLERKHKSFMCTSAEIILSWFLLSKYQLLLL